MNANEVATNHLDLDGVADLSSEDVLLEAMGEEGGAEGNKGKSKPAPKVANELNDDDDNEEANEVNDILASREKKASKKASKKEEDEEEEEEEEADNKGKKKSKKSPEDGINIGGDDEEEEDDDEEPESVLHYINKVHDLGFNLEKLPEDFDKKQEAQAVSTVISRILNNANARIAEYKGIQNLLQDEEVRTVLEAKRAGKSLKDIASQYITTVDGMSDEAVVRQDFKKKFSWANDQEITDMVQDHVKKGTLQKAANAAREEAKKVDTLTAAQEAEKARLKKQQDDEEYEEIVNEYAGYVSKINKVYGVPVTKEMKRDAFIFSTARDNKGMTRLDHALQSDEGMLLATLGILHLKKLIGKTASSSTNKARQDVLDLLDETPETLQSRSKKSKKGNNEDVAMLANKW